MSVVERARGAVGARFRLHGRSPEDGLDCVGLAAWAFGVTDVPSGYALRGGDAARVAAVVAGLGLVPVVEPGAGQLLLMRSGPGQLHLALSVEDGIVHADAGLRRVVERPGVVEWVVLGRWCAGPPHSVRAE